MDLTPKMQEMLRACASGPTSPWSFGAGVVGALKKRGLIVGTLEKSGGKQSTNYTLTDSGRAALAQGAA